jgi:hypothetical protein
VFVPPLPSPDRESPEYRHVNLLKSLGLLGALLFAALACPTASAQSTDGYHSIQIFPLVVDNTSFSNRFQFRNPHAVPLTIAVRFFPDRLLNQAPSQCNFQTIQPNSTLTVVGLRSLCSLPAGTQFGYVQMWEVSGQNLVFGAFARTQNPRGIGFSVEAFPAHTFTSATAVVTGLVRAAATVDVPVLMTNCFVGYLNDMSPAAPRTGTQVLMTLRDSAGNILGNSVAVPLASGQVVRHSDIFNIVGAPPGDYYDATLTVEEVGDDEPGIITFCTVQENDKFGADFRIGKQEWGAGGQANPTDTVGAQDNHVTRNTSVDVDSIGRAFAIPASATSSNTHVMYFRHPDYVQCEITDGAGARLPASFGLEMRLVGPSGLLIAGGDGQTGFSEVYLGDKTDRNGGSNTRYRIEVEDGEQNSGVARPYRLHCQSGSGHTMGDIIRYQEAADRF